MSRFSPFVRIARFGVRTFSSDPFEPFFSPFPAEVAVFAELAARVVLAVEFARVFTTLLSSDLAEALLAAVLELPEAALAAVFLIPVVFDAVLPFFSAITPLPSVGGAVRCCDERTRPPAACMTYMGPWSEVTLESSVCR